MMESPYRILTVNENNLGDHPQVICFINPIHTTYPLKITELRTPEEAQNAPSPYSVFNLIHNGKLLAGHYISETRFQNILKKEKLIKP